MKKILAMTVAIISTFCAMAADDGDYYWIGGASGNWADGANWSHTAGGTPAGEYPQDYSIRVNGASVAFAKGMGEPVKPDDNTGVCCAYEPVLAALKAAGVKVEYAIEPKRIPANKKWLRKLSPTPFVPMVTVKAGGHEIDACAGFTELFIDNGKDKNLTNCEIYGVGKKNAKVVCGELAALIGYIPGVKIEIDSKSRTMDLNTENGNR